VFTERGVGFLALPMSAGGREETDLLPNGWSAL